MGWLLIHFTQVAGRNHGNHGGTETRIYANFARSLYIRNDLRGFALPGLAPI